MTSGRGSSKVVVSSSAGAPPATARTKRTSSPAVNWTSLQARRGTTWPLRATATPKPDGAPAGGVGTPPCSSTSAATVVASVTSRGLPFN